MDKKYTASTRIQAQRMAKTAHGLFSRLGYWQLKWHNRGIPWKLEFTADTAPITPPSGGGGGGGTATTASYKITATAGIGGTISSGGTTTVSAAGQLTYTIKANEGYYIADVKVDGKSVGAVSSFAFEKITASHTIEASFAKKDSATVKDPIKQPANTSTNKNESQKM